MAVKVSRQSTDELFKLSAAVKDLNQKSLSVGFFESSKYENGTPVAQVAAANEFGTVDIPPRPFFRPAIADHKDEWRKILERGLRKALQGEIEVEAVYSQLGMMAAGQVSQKISQVYSPPLSESTIASRARKRKSPGASTKPLVDTGLMIQSATSKVEG